MALSPVAVFFALFAAPSAGLAVLAARDFLHRAEPGRLRRARLLLLAAAALPPLLVLATVLLTAEAPLRTSGGWVFLGWGGVCALLGPLGAWLFARAAAVPRKRLVKAAETVPMLLVLLNLVLVANAAMQT